MNQKITEYFNRISERKSRCLLNEKFTPLPPAANKSFSPKLAWPNNSRIRLWFKGSRLKQEDKATFTPNNVVNLFIFYELNRWLRDLNAESSLKYCLLGNFRITKNADPVKYSYSGCRIGSDFPSLVSTPIGVKASLFLELAWAPLCILITKIKTF